MGRLQYSGELSDKWWCDAAKKVLSPKGEYWAVLLHMVAELQGNP
jgi:hypothetical protein